MSINPTFVYWLLLFLLILQYIIFRDQLFDSYLLAAFVSCLSLLICE